MKKEQLGQIIDRKKEQLPEGVSILGPDDGLSSEIAADWLTTLLRQMYVQHGITKNRARLLADIESGSCRPWFATRDGAPIASAALIKQSDGSVEVGRAVSLMKNVGGLLMLLATVDHLITSGEPLVAEVRVSDEFLGVPSSEATQVVCFKHIGLNPHALVPAFNHGEPNRQEMFLFTSSNEIGEKEPLILPDDRASIDFISRTAVALARHGFQSPLELRTSREGLSSVRWEIVFSEPFNQIVPGDGSSLETTIKAVESKSPFTLISVPTDEVHSPAIVECLEAGFVPCGFDRKPDKDGHPILLLGKLRSGTLLAPIKIVSGLFSPGAVSAINSIDGSFRHRWR